MTIPFLLLLLVATAIVLVVLGVRGRPVFTTPTCARCRYDLRSMNFMSGDIGNCPECGAALDTPGAVNFGRLQTRSKLIWAGLGLIVLAGLIVIGGTLAIRNVRVQSPPIGPGAFANRTNAQVIATIPTTWNQPWVWQELERRLAAGTLPNPDVDAAINTLATTVSASVMRQPIPWADNFLNKARTQGRVSASTLQAFCRSYYAGPPDVTLRARQRQDAPMTVELDRNPTPWDLRGMQQVWVLSKVQAEDGTTIELMPGPRGAAELSGGRHRGRQPVQFLCSLPPGEHELTFTFDVGVLDERAILRGIGGTPGSKDKWPSPIATWQEQVKEKIAVVAPDEPVVAIVSGDGELPGITLEIEQAVARPARAGAEIVVRWKLAGTGTVPVCYAVDLVIGGQKYSFGTLMYGPTGRTTMSSYRETSEIPNLPRDVKSFDLVFTPDPRAAERQGNIEQIWGKEYRITNVPLERSDLDKN